MDEQQNLIVNNGVTKLVDTEGVELLTIELTPNMIVLLDKNGVPIMRIYKKALEWLQRHG